MLFELGASHCCPGIEGITIRSGENAGRLYRATIEVPKYQARFVQILFKKGFPKAPVVMVDGPTNRHLYLDGSLCMWTPADPPSNKWIFDDGLAALLGYITVHLFREAWYRETGEWLGPETHIPVTPIQNLNLGENR